MEFSCHFYWSGAHEFSQQSIENEDLWVLLVYLTMSIPIKLSHVLRSGEEDTPVFANLMFVCVLE